VVAFKSGAETASELSLSELVWIRGSTVPRILLPNQKANPVQQNICHPRLSKNLEDQIPTEEFLS